MSEEVKCSGLIEKFINIPRKIRYTDRDKKTVQMLIQNKGIQFMIDRNSVDIDYGKMDTQLSSKNRSCYQLTSDGVCILYKDQDIYQLIRRNIEFTKDKSRRHDIIQSSMSTTPRANMRKESPRPTVPATSTPRSTDTPVTMNHSANHQKLISSSFPAIRQSSRDDSRDDLESIQSSAETRLPTLPTIPATSKTHEVAQLKDQPKLASLPLIPRSGAKSGEAGIIFPNSPATPTPRSSSDTQAPSSSRPLISRNRVGDTSPSLDNQKENIPLEVAPKNSSFFDTFTRPSPSSHSVNSRAEGIRNLGNICYLNSVLEALLSLRGFTSDFTSLLWRSIRKFRLLNRTANNLTPSSSCMTQFVNVMK